MADGEEQQNEKYPLPSRYTAEGVADRQKRMWAHHGTEQHIDDDGADPDQTVNGMLEPLPDHVRDESSRLGDGSRR